MKKRPGDLVISIRMPKALIRLVDAAAQKEGRTRLGQIRFMVREALDARRSA